jgi:hypothetical protein
MFAETFEVTTAQSPEFSFATLCIEAIIVMTMSATIRPYSMAVAPLRSRSSFVMKRLLRIDFPPERTVRWMSFRSEVLTKG